MFRRLNNYFGHRLREVLALRASNGPYRFLIRGWEGINDLDLASRVIGTEFFRTELTPIPLPVKTVRSILIISPHQDDEVIGAGGALLLAAESGVKIDVLYLTDGAQMKVGHMADSISQTRCREAEAVCSILGATSHQLGLSNLNPSPTIEQIDRLAALIHDIRPQVVMAPWLLDSPGKHRIANHLLWLAHHRYPLPELEVWGYQVHNTLLPNGYVDITSAAEGKRQLIRCYESQDQFQYEHIAMGLAAWNTHFLRNQPGSKYAEIFFTLPLDELLRLVATFYLNDLRATYKGEPDLFDSMLKIHRLVTRNSLNTASLVPGSRSSNGSNGNKLAPHK